MEVQTTPPLPRHPGRSTMQVVQPLPLARLKPASLSLLTAVVAMTATIAVAAEAPCDGTDEVAPDFEPSVQIGVRTETHADSCTYVYTVLNKSRSTLTAVQVGWDEEREVCELTGASPHAPPDTAYSPPGWECIPLQHYDPSTFALGWQLVAAVADTGGIPPDTLISGFTVTLPRPDPLYERLHWLIRFRERPTAGYVGRVIPEEDLDIDRPETGTVAGKATDERGSRIPNPVVFVKGKMLGSVSRSDGTYLIAGVPVGLRALVARTTGYRPCEKGRVRVAPNDTTTVDLRLTTWPVEAATPAGPCAPYVTARDRVGLSFPGSIVDTVGARFLDRRESVPPRTGGDTSEPRAFIYSLSNNEVSFAYRGLGQDTVGRAFVADVHRSFRTADEERLIRIAEETYPPVDAVVAVAESHPGGHAPPAEERLWWYGEFDGVRLPYAVTLDAVRYYLGLTQALGRGDTTRTHGIRMKHSEFSYSAGISRHPSTYSRDGRVFRDVYVVEMRLNWSDYCGSECACGFSLDRTVVLRRDGTILCVFGDREPMVVVS